VSKATHSIEVDAPVDRVFALWRDFENWPKFLPNVKEAIDTGERTAMCKLATPMGTLDCHAEIINEHPGESFQWHTTSGAVDFLGKAAFEATPEGATRVTVSMEYHAPLGRIGEMVARWLHEDPCAELPNELRRFKGLVEGSGSGAASA
jgi:uncharacterized membrane protein